MSAYTLSHDQMLMKMRLTAPNPLHKEMQPHTRVLVLLLTVKTQVSLPNIICPYKCNLTVISETEESQLEANGYVTISSLYSLPLRYSIQCALVTWNQM
jgi:hypothetical protein